MDVGKDTQKSDMRGMPDPACGCDSKPTPSALKRRLRTWKTSGKKTWNIFKKSKEGMIGLIMLLVMVFMAIFAPLLTPFTPAFTAPTIDTYVADDKNVTLPSSPQVNWSAPLGMTLQKTLGGGLNLTKILEYSNNGTVYLYQVSAGVKSRINVNEKPQIYTHESNGIPANVQYLKYVFLDLNQVRIIMAGSDGLYVFSEDLKLLEKYILSFKPKYYSEIWNGYPGGGMTALVMADEHDIVIYSITPHVEIPGQKPIPRSYLTTWKLLDSKITSAPLVMYLPRNPSYSNGTMLVLSTPTELRAYNITANVSGTLIREYTNLRIGEFMWSTNLTVDGQQYQMLPDNSLIFPYPKADQLGFGKDRILVATTQNIILSFARNNGSFQWAQKLIIKTQSFRDYRLSGLCPTERAGAEGILAIAETSEKTLVATFDVGTGLVVNNGTQFIVLDGKVNIIPFYVPGLHYYLVSTDLGNVYILRETMTRAASFSILGGSKTPAVFLGNIVEQRSITGNYFGVITGKNNLYIVSLTGTNNAPLPPGAYPSGNRYIFGTDDAGHDIFSWLIYGARTELVVGILAALVAVLMGTFIGIAAGYFGGSADMVTSGFVDVLLCLPGLPILIILSSVLGPSIINIIIIVGVLGWPGITRVVRSVVLSLKERAYMDSARVTGASSGRIIAKHILPNVMPYAFFYMAISVSGAILTEAALAFLGFGDPNAITWGMMLQYLQLSGHTLDAWWWLLPPGLMITILSLSFYLIGRGFDEVLDPKLRER